MNASSFCAGFPTVHADIAERTIGNSAAYIKARLERLRNDKTLIVQAAAQAQKAAEFILNGQSEKVAGAS